MKEFKHSKKRIILSLILYVLMAIFVFVYRIQITTLLNEKLFHLNIKFNFDRLCLAVFSIAIGYPIVSQFIRYTMDDLDKIIPMVKEKLTKDKVSIEDRMFSERISFLISNIRNQLKEFHTYYEFRHHIAISFVLLFLSAGNNAVNENDFQRPGLILLSNFSMIFFIVIFGIFLYSKIHKINGYLSEINRKIARIHRECTQTYAGRILGFLGNSGDDEDEDE